MNKFFTMLLTAAALAIAIPASAEECIPNLSRVAEVDTGKDAHTATGGHSCTDGAGAVGCAGADEVRGTSGANKGGLRMYFDNDNCQRLPEDLIAEEPEGCIFSIWGYWETNGIDGLQRNDPGLDDDLTTPVDDTCGGAIAADLVFF